MPPFQNNPAVARKRNDTCPPVVGCGGEIVSVAERAGWLDCRAPQQKHSTNGILPLPMLLLRPQLFDNPTAPTKDHRPRAFAPAVLARTPSVSLGAHPLCIPGVRRRRPASPRPPQSEKRQSVDQHHATRPASHNLPSLRVPCAPGATQTSRATKHSTQPKQPTRATPREHTMPLYVDDASCNSPCANTFRRTTKIHEVQHTSRALHKAAPRRLCGQDFPWVGSTEQARGEE